jgi:DNA-binding transcriptional MerR regulator
MSRKINRKRTMQIGDFACRAGVSVRAVRYYEELGLLKPESHSGGGFRLYGPEALKRVLFIGFFKDLGLSLAEIGTILSAKKPTGGDRGAVDFLLRVFGEKLALVEERIAALARVRVDLSKAVEILRSCESCDHAVLLDATGCGECANLMPRDLVPAALEVILQ